MAIELSSKGWVGINLPKWHRNQEEGDIACFGDSWQARE